MDTCYLPLNIISQFWRIPSKGTLNFCRFCRNSQLFLHKIFFVIAFFSRDDANSSHYFILVFNILLTAQSYENEIRSHNNCINKRLQNEFIWFYFWPVFGLSSCSWNVQLLNYLIDNEYFWESTIKSWNFSYISPVICGTITYLCIFSTA